MTNPPAKSPLTVVRKVAAQSNPKVQRLDNPIVLREGRENIKAHVRYIPHDGRPTEASLKIWKENKDGAEKADASITLNDGEIKALAEYIEQADVFKSAETGQYVLVPYAGNGFDLRGKNPKAVTKALLGALSQVDLANQIFTADIPTDFAQTLQYAARAAKIKTAMDELRTLVEDPQTLEPKFQAWLKSYAWILGNQFVALEDIRQIDRNHQLDGLVKGFTGFCDVIELKRANMDVLVWDESHQGYFFSKDVSATLGQTVTYLERLHNVARTGLEDAEHIKAFYPHGTIVIGRSHDWKEKQHKALQAHNGHLQRVRVITYDQLLAIVENLYQTVVPSPARET